MPSLVEKNSYMNQIKSIAISRKATSVREDLHMAHKKKGEKESQSEYSAQCTQLKQSGINSVRLRIQLAIKAISRQGKAKRKKKSADTDTYVYVKITQDMLAGDQGLCGQLKEKKTSTISSSTSSTAASTSAYYARGLVVAHSRKLSATLGGSTSTRPGVRKLILKTYDFVDFSNATIPIALGGSTTTSPPIVIEILRQQLNDIIVDYAAPTMPHPIKAKFSASKKSIII
jgi:hypothetical protein